MNNMFISSAKKADAVENFVKSKREELEKMVPGFVDDRRFTDIVLSFYERGIRDGAQMMLERMTDIIAARNATHVSAQMSEASASGKLNDAFIYHDTIEAKEVDLKQKSFVKIDRKLLFEICDAILNHYGYSDVNDCPENDSECFWGKWDEGFRKKVENIRRNS